MLSRRAFLGASFAATAPSQTRRPNILVIVADDLGYGSIGVQGMRDVPTPHIDSLAKSGVRFTNGYVSCPVCSPTRAGLNTGRYQQRFGHELNPGPAAEADPSFGLPLDQVTLGDRLKPLGYRTGMVGKWHLGYQPQFHPLKRGFDSFFGFLGGAHSYLDANADASNPIFRGTEKVDEKEYLTDAFAREAVAFIDRHQRDPFYLYLTFNAVHAPMQTVKKYRSRFPAIADTQRQTFAGMMCAMDDAIGAILAKLRAAKIEDDTLIFFISDNGGPTAVNTSSNAPLRGFKGQTYEGGIRVPFLMQWKRRLAAGRVYEQPVISLDIHPTALAAAGSAAPAGLDGVNLLPHLSGENKSAPHAELYWRFGNTRAMRQGDWKLVQVNGGPTELYHLGKDIGEANNLAAAEPARMKQLEETYAAWDRQLMPPKWSTERAGKKGKGKKKKKKA